MPMLLGCADGLLQLEHEWRRLDCPLPKADFIAQDEGCIAAADTDGLLWHAGREQRCPRGIEALSLWRGHALLLSSDTDCLTLYAPDGEALITTRVGVYPQGLCIRDDTAYVCGGADGCVHLLTLPGMYLYRSIPLPGMPQRIAAAARTLHVLCLTEDNGVHCTLVRIDRTTGQWDITACRPGLPGAVSAESDGSLWAAASEQLLHFPPGAAQADTVYRGFGLIRHIDAHQGTALVTDPLEELCAVCSPDGASVVYRGQVGQAFFLR